MFKIYNGEDHFYQWDLGQRLTMDEPFTKVHFCNQTEDCALVCETYEEDGKRLVKVPNILLQTTNNIRVYGCYEEDENTCCTKNMRIFRVIARGKPEDYIYTETEVLNWEKIVAKVDAALDDIGYYIPTVDSNGNLSWEGSVEALPEVETVNIKGAKGDTGAAFTYDMFTEAQLAALKGAKGDKGEPGDDYVLTSNDKQEIANLVLAALPSSEEVSY